ncbi:MAG: GYD domain-containing protein [Gemmatimonadetes bacterium]|nr:GYD domain-containing protein [Gemmatimonadota bacterium]
MATYVILSRFSPEAFREPKQFRELADSVSAQIKRECPGVKWKASYATLGRFDVVDVVEAEDPKEIEKVAMIIRALGHSTTETLLATPWKEFLAGL